MLDISPQGTMGHEGPSWTQSSRSPNLDTAQAALPKLRASFQKQQALSANDDVLAPGMWTKRRNWDTASHPSSTVNTQQLSRKEKNDAN